MLLRRGSPPVEEARRRILAILEDLPTAARPRHSVGWGRWRQWWARSRGRLTHGSHAIIEELGLRQTGAADSIALADVEIIAGDLVAAERFRSGVAELEASRGQVQHRERGVAPGAGRGANRPDDEGKGSRERAADLDAGGFAESGVSSSGSNLPHVAAKAKAEEQLRESDLFMSYLSESGMEADALLQGAEAAS